MLESSCLRKIRHLNYLSALRHAVKVHNNETVVIYPCSYCEGMHVGHSVAENNGDLRKHCGDNDKGFMTFALIVLGLESN